MANFIPVDHDPFAENVAQKFIPVDHDPFASAPTSSSSAIASSDSPSTPTLDGLEKAFTPYADLGTGFYRGVQNITDTALKGGSRAVDYAAGLMGYNPEASKYIDNAIESGHENYKKEVGDSGFAKAGEVGGEIFGTAPLAGVKIMQGATLLPRMANGALQGVTQATATSSGYDAPVKSQAAVGAGVGALAPPLVSGLAKLASPLIGAGQKAYQGIAGKIPGATNISEETGNLADYLQKGLDRVGVDYRALTPEVQKSLLTDAEKSLRTTGTISPDMLIRNADMQAIGVKPTLGAITRDPALWQFEQNTAGVRGEAGDKLTQRFVENNRAITESLEKLKGKTGGIAATPYEAGEGAVGATKAKYSEMQKEIGAQYNAIREAKGNDIGLQPRGLFKAIEENIDNADADSIMTSIQRKMTRYGLVDGKGIPKDRAFLTVENAEELRKFIGALGDKGDPSIRRIKGTIIDALDDDVINTAGDDAFKAARAAARERFQEFSPKPLKSITEDKTVADDVLKRNVLSAKVQDLSAFKNSLNTGTPEQMGRGGQAWNDLRLQTMQHIIDQSADAGGKIQGSRLAKALDALGKDRLEVIFSPEELSQLGTIRRAAYNTTVAVPESRVNYSGTGAFLADLMGRAGLGKNIVKAANFATNIPVLGPAISPLTGAIKVGGKMMDEAATSAAVDKSLQASPQEVEAILQKTKSQEERNALIAKMLASTPVSQGAVALSNTLRERRK